MRDLPVWAIVAALVMSVPIAVGVSAYGRPIALGRGLARGVAPTNHE